MPRASPGRISSWSIASRNAPPLASCATRSTPGVLRPDRVHAELGEIVAGLKPGRTTAQQITVADLTGVGFQDTAIASADLEIWKSGNLEI